jgi:hypothetical protein
MDFFLAGCKGEPKILALEKGGTHGGAPFQRTVLAAAGLRGKYPYHSLMNGW